MNIISSSRRAERARELSKPIKGFSDTYKAGEIARVFYLTMKDPSYSTEDVPVYSILSYSPLGRQINGKELNVKQYFVPSDAEVDAEGIVIGQCKGQPYQAISRAIREAEKATEIANARLNTDLEEATLNQTIKEIEEKYDGKQKADGQFQAGDRDKQPVIGRLERRTITFGLYVPLDSDTEKPILKDMRVFMKTMSSSELKKHHEALDKGKVKLAAEENGLLELQYSFPNTTDKSEIGRTQPSHQSGANLLCELYPDEWVDIKKMIEKLPQNEEDCAAKAKVGSPWTAAQWASAFEMYLIKNNTKLDILPETELEAVSRCEEVFTAARLRLPKAIAEAKARKSEEDEAKEAPAPNEPQVSDEDYITNLTKVEAADAQAYADSLADGSDVLAGVDLSSIELPQ